MPKRKASEVSTVSGGPARVICPACKSEISGDGATLHALSKYLEELIETAGDVEKLEKALGEMEVKLTAARAELQKAKEEAKPKPEAKKDESVGQKVGDGKPKPPSGEWW
jgi:hypothetical protein